MTHVYRITTAPFTADAFTGDGARLHGGRWNPKGWRMVYAAATRSLALLEMLVQDQPLRARYVFIPAELQPRLRVRRVSTADLPSDWRKPTAAEQLRQIGQSWLERGESAVLAVPSAVLPREENFLLNPNHDDFRRILIGDAEPLDLDSRLVRPRL
jgi:RES domain-containing protein